MVNTFDPYPPAPQHRAVDQLTGSVDWRGKFNDATASRDASRAACQNLITALALVRDEMAEMRCRIHELEAENEALKAAL